MTHPKVVEVMGGKEKMVAALTKELKVMKDAGMEFKSAKVLDPSNLVRVEKEIFVVVPLTLELTSPKRKVTTKGALVGLSRDEGKTWVFVDATPGRDKLKEMIPNLPDAIVLPKKEPPVITKE